MTVNAGDSLDVAYSLVDVLNAPATLPDLVLVIVNAIQVIALAYIASECRKNAKHRH